MNDPSSTQIEPGGFPCGWFDHLAIGIDVGGTKIAAGVVTEFGKVLDSIRIETPANKDTKRTVALLDRMVRSFLEKFPTVCAVGVGCAGLVEWPSGVIRYAANNNYRNLQLREELETSTGLSTTVENDANAAAWAECVLGSGKDAADVLMLTVGTGIGAGYCFGKKLFRGSTGLGVELGHIVVDPNGRKCACGNRGCLETLASGSALGLAGKKIAMSQPIGTIAELAASPDKVTGETVCEAARQGDPSALELFEDIGKWLGLGVATLVNLFDPEVVVIGGGLIEAESLLLRPTIVSFERHVYARNYRRLPKIVSAAMGPESGMVGAALLAIERSSTRSAHMKRRT